MGDEVFFAEGDVRVTRSHLIVGNEMYAIGKINTIRSVEQQSGNLIVGVGVIASLILLVNSPLFGAALLATILVYLYKRKTIYGLEITTSSGNQTAFTTTDEQQMKQLIAGLMRAMDSSHEDEGE